MKTSTRVREIGEKLKGIAQLHDQYAQFKKRLDEAVATGKNIFQHSTERTDKRMVVCLAERWASGQGGFQLWSELEEEDASFAMLIFQRHVNRKLAEIDAALAELTTELETLK